MRNRFEFDQTFLTKTLRISRRLLALSGLYCGFASVQLGLKYGMGFSFVSDMLFPRALTGLGISLLVFVTLTFYEEKKFFKAQKLIEICCFMTLFCIAVFGILINYFDHRLEFELFDISLASSGCLFLLTLGQFFRRFAGQRYAKYYQLLFFSSGVISLSALFGFASGQDSIQSLTLFHGMTMAAALNFTICSFSISLIEPQAGWISVFTADNRGSRLLRRSLCICLPVLFMVVALVIYGDIHGYYDHRFAFNLISMSSFLIFGLALFAISLHFNTVDRNHHLAVEEIHRREQDLRDAQSLAKVGSWSMNPTTQSVTWSPQMYEIFGLEEGTFIHSDLMDEFMRPEDLAIVRSQIKKCHETGEGLDVQHQLIRRNGEVRVVHGRAELRMNSETGEREVHGTIHDITDTQGVLNQLQAAEKQYNDLYNEAPDMLISVDISSGNIVKCNRTLLRILGYQEDEVLGQHVSKLYAPESYVLIPRIRQKFYDKGFIQNEEIVAMTKNGKRIDISLNSIATKNSKNEIVHSQSVWRDISDVKQARELLIREKAAAESARIKANFVAAMSHEIRTPLNGVVGMSEILIASNLSPEQRDYADTIKQSADTLLFLVNDILDFSKIESGKVELSEEIFSLEEFVREIEKQMNWSANRKKLSLKFNVQGVEGIVFRADYNRLKQILVNLISNAIKFTDQGEIYVNLVAKKLDSKMSSVHIEVIDTGIGISDEESKRLFLPFSQADSSISRRFGGTGLGLSISQSLAHLMESEIQMHSQVGRGSKFFFDLRLGYFSETQKEVRSQKNEPKVFKFSPRILVGEDQEVNRKVIGFMLQDLGCDVTFAQNGEEVLTWLQKENFDLIVMDIQMPLLDGYETTKKIRENQDLHISQIPIIAVTAHAMEEDREFSLRMGMNDHMSKPFTRQGLQEKIEKWLPPNAFHLKNEIHFERDRKEERTTISEKKPLDTRLLSELLQVGVERRTDLISHVLEIYESKLPDRLEKIRFALQEKNIDKAFRDIHALKSSTSVLGAHALGQICDDVTQFVKRGQFSEAENLFAKIEDQGQALGQQVRQFLGNPDSLL